MLASGPKDMQHTVDELIVGLKRQYLLVDPDVWAALMPDRSGSGKQPPSWFPGQYSAYTQTMKVVTGSVKKSRNTLIKEYVRYWTEGSAPVNVEVARSESAVGEVCEHNSAEGRGAKDHFDRALDARLGAPLEDNPDVAITRLQVQIVACKAMKAADREEKKRKVQEDKERKQTERQSKKPRI